MEHEPKFGLGYPTHKLQAKLSHAIQLGNWVYFPQTSNSLKETRPQKLYQVPLWLQKAQVNTGNLLICKPNPYFHFHVF